jgi:hypothetical protein
MLKKTSRKPSAISRNPESESYVEEQTRASQQTIEIYGPGPSRGRFRRRDVHTPQRAVLRSVDPYLLQSTLDGLSVAAARLKVLTWSD